MTVKRSKSKSIWVNLEIAAERYSSLARTVKPWGAEEDEEDEE